MNTFIGGLLVLSLISKSTPIGVTFVAYDVLRTKDQIIYLMKKDDEPLEVKEDDINDIMDDIARESRELKSLLKEKCQVVGSMEVKMDLNVHTKAKLSNNQINDFKSFNKNVVETEAELSSLFGNLSQKKEFALLQNEILHNDTDMDFVYRELNQISITQKKAIEKLSSFINQNKPIADRI